MKINLFPTGKIYVDCERNVIFASLPRHGLPNSIQGPQMDAVATADRAAFGSHAVEPDPMK